MTRRVVVQWAPDSYQRDSELDILHQGQLEGAIMLGLPESRGHWQTYRSLPAIGSSGGSRSLGRASLTQGGARVFKRSRAWRNPWRVGAAGMPLAGASIYSQVPFHPRGSSAVWRGSKSRPPTWRKAGHGSSRSPHQSHVLMGNEAREEEGGRSVPPPLSVARRIGAEERGRLGGGAPCKPEPEPGQGGCLTTVLWATRSFPARRALGASGAPATGRSPGQGRI